MSKILELREKRAKAWEAAKAFLDTKRGMTSVSLHRWLRRRIWTGFDFRVLFSLIGRLFPVILVENSWLGHRKTGS